MLRVEDAELGEHVAGFELQAVGQSRRREKGFFDLEGGLSAAGIDRGEQMRLPGEEGIDRAAQRDFGLPQGEAALLRVVGAALQGGERGVPFARPAGIEQYVRRNVDQADLRVPAQRLPPQRRLLRSGIGDVQLGQGAVQRRSRHPRRRVGASVPCGLAIALSGLGGRFFLHGLNSLLELADGRLQGFDLFAQHLNLGRGAGLCTCRSSEAGEGDHPHRQEPHDNDMFHGSLVSFVRAGRSARLWLMPAAAICSFVEKNGADANVERADEDESRGSSDRAADGQAREGGARDGATAYRTLRTIGCVRSANDAAACGTLWADVRVTPSAGCTKPAAHGPHSCRTPASPAWT